ncbi:MAG: hypothetical protein IKR73_01475, partial [Oscillospiraceae bacterium]|nr:hypothetical protein [Oscillospiraceae bacterium]
DSGDMDVTIMRSDTKIECGGNEIVGIGDANGRGNVTTDSCKLSLTMLAKATKGIISKYGNVSMTETVTEIKTG